MAPAALEQENHARDAEFNKAMHGKSATSQGGIASMLSKNQAAQKAAVDEYFKHWDNKPAENETEEMRAERRSQYATLTRQYVHAQMLCLPTDLSKLLQSCHRFVRVRLGWLVPFLSLCLW